MKNWILFQNNGEIENNSFELIGASTKRGDSTKLGFFGSGLKYSVAYMFRNNINFKVFSGENELVFSTEEATIKDKSFDRICINNKPTSYTTTMGPTWTEDWFVFREIWCNCLDEENASIIKNALDPSGTEGTTRIYIELTDKLNTIIDNWDEYFSDEREEFYTISNVNSYHLGDVTIQDVKIYQKTKGILYRMGIQVFNTDRLLFDYGCKSVNINEDRTAKNTFYLDYMFCNMAAEINSENWLKSVLRKEESREYKALEGNSPSSNFSAKWIEFSHNYTLVVREKSGKYHSELSSCKNECFLIPQHFACKLKEAIPDVVILGMSKSLNGSSFETIEPTAKQKFLLKEVLNSLKEMKYEILFDINIVDFQDADRMGQADIQTKQIYIGEKTFDMGRKELALTLMEEQEHILSQKHDETRAFQTHIFTKWLTYMEEQSALFL